MDMLHHALDDELNTALLLDELQHAACHHGDNNQFAHADHAVAHRPHPSEDIETACKDANAARQ